jgi:large subunit ribosomal protein L11
MESMFTRQQLVQMQVKLLVEGGSMQPGPALSQKIGPLGLNIGQIIQKVNDATKDFHGLKVPVELNINPSTKTFEVKVFSPPVAELLKKEMGIEKGSGEQKKTRVANASIEQIILIAKTKMPNLLSRDLKSAVKTIVGSCVSLGILIENKPAVEIAREIEEGKYDDEISSEKIETSQEKKKQLNEFFSKIKSEQERIKKLEDEATKAAEATKTAEAAAGKPTVATEEKKEDKKETEKTKK